MNNKTNIVRVGGGVINKKPLEIRTYTDLTLLGRNSSGLNKYRGIIIKCSRYVFEMITTIKDATSH